MENIFTANIKSVLEKHFGKTADDIFDKSQLIQYINEKTRSANKGSKSQRAICPTCVYKNVTECIAHSLSVWDNVEKCLNLLKLPRHKGKSAMKLELTNNDGLVLQTFKQNHYSWWKTQSFDMASATTI